MNKLLLAFRVLVLWLVVLTAQASTENPLIKVVGFTLINADNDLEIANLSNGDVINLAELPSQRINIVANIQPNILPLQIGSVVFTLNNSKYTENEIPFALRGDISGNYNHWVPPVGNYTLNATPYTEAGGKGTPGKSFTINFKVINERLNLPEAVYRINTGGADYITPEGIVFEADNYSFSSKATYSNKAINDIKNTDADRLYLTEHIADQDSGQFYYYLPVAPGNYTVKLHFAEIYFGVVQWEANSNPVGKRIFDVTVEGKEMLVDFDIAAEAGVATALVKTFEVSSNDGNIVIGFSGKVNRPKVSAIEVLVSSTLNTPPVADAGENKAIRLPEDSTTLVGTWSDADGYVTDVKWTQVSGPRATMQGTTSSNLELSNLKANTYIFRLTVTDNKGDEHSDEVALVVIAAAHLQITAHPNPVTDILKINTNQNNDSPLNIRIYNKLGVLSSEMLGVVPKANNYEVNISSLSPDIYMLQVELEGAIEQIRIVKE